MADDPSKTEAATPKRRNKVRGEGNVPKSAELGKTITVFAGVLGLYLYFPVIAEHVRELFHYFFANAATFPVTAQNVYSLLLLAMKELAIMTMPVLLIIGVSAFVVLRLQVGKLWTTKVFKIKWQNFNIFNGLKRMFASPQTLTRLFKSLFLALIIGSIPFLFIRREFTHFLPLYYADAAGLGTYLLTTSFRMVLYTLLPMVILALVDLWYTRYKYEESIKMTKQEVKDEMRQSEGDPMIKQKQREKMMRTLGARMMQQVPKADVVVTNPTHFAVALRYDPTESPAPMVVAKGADRMAEKIKTVAREHHVPIRENRPLARSLYKSVEVGQPIPEDMYKAVAAVLAEIWKLQGKMPGRPGA